jgi:lysozyme family protein
MSDPLVERVLRGVIEREGGYVDHPADHGGPTKYGITLRTLEAWRGTPVTAADVAALTVEEATALYVARYATPLARLEFAPDLFRLLLDIAVLSGPSTAVRLLQSTLNRAGESLAVDGALGPRTVMAVVRKDPAVLLQALIKARCRALVQLVTRDPTQLVFLEGWLMRTLDFLPAAA